jgi:phospho-N-acetylmuramoyl-pentapeptide-transferase
MGGIAIVVAAFCGWAAAHLRRGVIFTDTGLIVVGTVLGAAFVGFLDDWLKVRNRRNLGLNKRTKTLGLLAVGIMFAVLMLTQTGVSTNLSFTRLGIPDVDLGPIGWAVLAVLMIQSTSNAVNVTDGLDGLAGGSAIFSLFALTIVAFWAFRNPETYQVAHALDLAVFAMAMVGGCAGFLWYNAAPAKIFMGDVGSLAIGTAMACLALATNTHLLLPIIGGLFVMETMSVILQVISFRLFGGRRIFKMSPIHHHFELLGWPETTIIIRFWIIQGLFCAVAIGIFLADFISTGNTN